MHQSDNLSDLPYLHLARFVETSFSAILSDLDGTWTPESRKLSADAIAVLATLLLRGIPTGFVSARALWGDRDGQGEKLADVATAVEDYAKSIRLDTQATDLMLSFLYLLPENGNYMVRASDMAHVIGFGFDQPGMDSPLCASLDTYLQTIVSGPISDCLGIKTFTVTVRLDYLRGFSGYPGDATVREEIASILASHNRDYVLENSGTSLEITPLGAGKGSALRNFVGIVCDDHPQLAVSDDTVVTIGDMGAEGGTDLPLLDRFGGVSVGHTSEHSKALPLADLLNSQGWPVTSWLLRNLRFDQAPPTLVVSLGGSKVAIGILFSNGVVISHETFEWRSKFGISDDESDSDILVSGIAKSLLSIVGMQTYGAIDRIGISTKGPLETIDGEVVLGPGKKCTTLPFRDYPLVSRLRQCLKSLSSSDDQQLFSQSVEISVLHDGAAAVLGELSSIGTFPGALDATAVIIGTGIGIGVVENGALFEGVGNSEGDDSDDFVRVFGSLGRHAVYIPDGTTYRYEYRGVDLGTTQGAHTDTEAHMSTRLSGPALARRVAKAVLDHLNPEDMDTFVTTSGVTSHSLSTLSEITPTGSSTRDVEAGVLTGLTHCAKNGEGWAIRELIDIGTEIGTALGSFIDTFRDRLFVTRIVLVSTVSEKLGRGVSTQDELDLVLAAIRDGSQRHLAANGWENNEAVIAAQAIRRSVLGVEREFLAFQPHQ